MSINYGTNKVRSFHNGSEMMWVAHHHVDMSYIVDISEMKLETPSSPEYQHYSSDLGDAVAQQQDQLQSI
jgi:hypothetical protein